MNRDKENVRCLRIALEKNYLDMVRNGYSAVAGRWLFVHFASFSPNGCAYSLVAFPNRRASSASFTSNAYCYQDTDCNQN